MEITEITDSLKTKIKESKKISGLNSKHFGFKNWHTTTLNLLRNLPPIYLPDINDFKKLAFEDTKFHRGKRFFSQTDNTKYREDLESAAVILEKIISFKIPDKHKTGGGVTSGTDDTKKTVKKPPRKPLPKKQGDTGTSSVKKSKKPKTSKDAKGPAKTGKASGRKKKSTK